MKPFDAALKGSKEIAFTILSITLSLVAVFIPVLLMSGVVGRVFREFAVTITVAILVSGFVSLDADADAVRADTERAQARQGGRPVLAPLRLLRRQPRRRAIASRSTSS